MRDQLVPIFAFMLAVALIFPPWLLLTRAATKLRGAVMASHKTTFRLIIALALFSLLFNVGYVVGVFLGADKVQITPNWAMAVALTLAWATFWGRQALNHVGRYRRSIRH